MRNFQPHPGPSRRAVSTRPEASGRGEKSRKLWGRFLLIALTLGWLALLPLEAQEKPPLLLFETQLGAQPDGFGGESPVARGEVYNHGAQAYRNVQISVEAYTAAGEVIGEGYGFLVNACGTALLDYALPPGRSQPYSAPFELFGEGDVARVELDIAAEAVPMTLPPPINMPGLHFITTGEVVMLEWLDADSFIYGSGCAGEVFTELDWWHYSLTDNALSAIEHPAAARVNPEMIARSDAALVTQSGELNPALFFGSQMTFPPNARRIVYQNDLHTIFSAEFDGSYKRLIHDGLHKRSLRGFLWAEVPGVFLAYYFGAYGEQVYYFSADVSGKMLSNRLEELPPSSIVPGPAPDGLAAVVGREIDAVSGYYWQNAYGGAELLFAAELPGNNYPAPIVTRERIYIIRPIDDIATLQCYTRATWQLATISALPLRLTREARAWAWLSPDGSKLALAANGTDGGLWWLELPAGCG